MEVRSDILFDPLRPPDALLRLGRSFVDHYRFVSPHDYGWRASLLVQFLRARRSQLDAGGIRRGNADTELSAAFSIRYDRPRLAAILEAFVLAAEPAPRIAESIGISGAAVEWYEAVFFDVRDRLTSDLFVLESVIEPSLPRLPDDFVAYAARLVGFFVGADELRQFLGLQSHKTADDLVARRRSSAQIALELQLHGAARRGGMEQQTLRGLLQVLGELRNQRKEIAGAALTPFEQNIQAFFDQTKFMVGRHGHPPSPLDEFANSRAALHPEEEWMILNDIPLPNAEEIKAMRFPPRRDAEATSDGQN